MPAFRSIVCLLILGFGPSVQAATLSVLWDSNEEPDIGGYLVSYGTISGVYTNSVDVGNQTAGQLTGLADGTTYYIVVQAYTTDGSMGYPSAEVFAKTSPGPAPPPQRPAPPSIVCPRIPTGTSYDGKAVVINFDNPTIAGEAQPLTTRCAPASGSLFPVGSKPVMCMVLIESLQQTLSCTTAATVVAAPPPDPPSIACPVIPAVTSKGRSRVPVTFPGPIVTGGAQPVSTSCRLLSGSLFAVGTTAVTCTTTDSWQRAAACDTVVTVSTRSPASKSGGKGPRPPVEAPASRK